MEAGNHSLFEVHQMIYAGIDVGKADLQLAVFQSYSVSFKNDLKGHKAIIKRLKKEGAEVRVVLEATATYHLGIATELHEAGIPVMIANPRVTKNFARMRRRGKTDKMDASSLADFNSIQQDFMPWTPPSSVARELRAVCRRRGQLVRERAAENVRLEEIKCERRPLKALIRDIEGHIKQLSKRIERLEKLALKIVDGDEKFAADHALLCTIPGIADITSLIILSECAHLPKNMDARQLVAYAGLDPTPYESGKMVAGRHISKRGNKRLRTALYIAAWNVSMHSPEAKARRQKLLDKGKASNVAYIANARRLLHSIHGILKHRTPWDGSLFYKIPEITE